MTTQAIFLSYASQDADAARRLCEALRAEGLEVWFDQSELRGGDAWDASIRKQIKECALFVPIISALAGQGVRAGDAGWAEMIGAFSVPASTPIPLSFPPGASHGAEEQRRM